MSEQENLASPVKNKQARKPRKIGRNHARSAEVLDGNPSEWTQLYRCFDEWGRLLYVGISLSSLSRFIQHRDQSHWFRLIATIKVEHYCTRKDALLAEKTAIKKEKPYFNKIHNGLWRVREKWEHPYQKFADAIGEMVMKAST